VLLSPNLLKRDDALHHLFFLVNHALLKTGKPVRLPNGHSLWFTKSEGLLSWVGNLCVILLVQKTEDIQNKQRDKKDNHHRVIA